MIPLTALALLLLASPVLAGSVRCTTYEEKTLIDMLMQVFGRSAAEIIRHLITRATPADFPPSWRGDP